LAAVDDVGGLEKKTEKRSWEFERPTEVVERGGDGEPRAAAL
jgi:hypothetical protein